MMKRSPGVVIMTTHNYRDLVQVCMGKCELLILYFDHTSFVSDFDYCSGQACTTLGCNCIVKRHSRSVDLKCYGCGKCKSKLVEVEVPNGLNKSSGLMDRMPKKQVSPSGYDLFVKEHSRWFARN
jgi:hypothetical protein